MYDLNKDKKNVVGDKNLGKNENETGRKKLAED